jgi:hypothetical protein
MSKHIKSLSDIVIKSDNGFIVLASIVSPLLDVETKNPIVVAG